MAQDRGLVATLNSDGSVNWSCESGMGTHEIELLENGRVFVHTAFDALAAVTLEKETFERGRRLRPQPKDKAKPHGFKRLDNRMTMVARTGTRRITEVDRAGQGRLEISLQVDNPDSRRDARVPRSTAGRAALANTREGWRRRCVGSQRGCGLGLQLGTEGDPKPLRSGPGTPVDSTQMLPTGVAVIGGWTDNGVLELSPGGESERGLRSSELPGIHPMALT